MSFDVRIERGDLTLSTTALLHDALTETTYDELVEAAAGKTEAEVQALLVKRSPAPDVPAAITTHNALHAEQAFGKEHVERKIRERRDPRQRGSPSAPCDLAASGLMNIGFRRAEVTAVLREALAVLT